MFPDKFVCLIAVATVHNKVVFVLDWLGLGWIGLVLEWVESGRLSSRAPEN